MKNINNTVNIIGVLTGVLFAIGVVGMPAFYHYFSNGKIFPPPLPKTLSELTSVNNLSLERMEGFLECKHLSTISSPRFPEDYQRAQRYCRKIQDIKDSRWLKKVDEERMLKYKDIKIPELKE